MRYEKIIDYFGADGLLHIICCMVIMQLLSNFLPLWAAVLITAAIGLGKEYIWDKQLKKVRLTNATCWQIA